MNQTRIRRNRTAGSARLFGGFTMGMEGKVAGGLKAMVNLSKTEWQGMRQTLDEIFRLIDTTFNMGIIGLGDILLPTQGLFPA